MRIKISRTTSVHIAAAMVFVAFFSGVGPVSFADVPSATQDHRLTLTVQDDGIGLPQNFDPESASTLGLRIVSKLINQLEGQFETGPSEGTGALFRITFPRPVNCKFGAKS
jgi:two-component sensor histidine kinase